MHKSPRFGPAMSAIALASAIAGCAAPQSNVRSASIFGGNPDKSNIGVATRALMALNAKEYPTAVKYAERAVENSPNDAGFRALLGNAYFASGRFGSAESAYRDSLALVPTQPQVVLKLALVQIAQGRHGEAVAFLNSARDVLDAADFGLALALAGQPQDAVMVLESAARETSADARLRQNLALAHALSGDWTAARTVAAQDLSADLVDARIQQWMTFAKPAYASDQVAALTGVSPVAGDPGQPTRLALRAAPTRTAQAAPVEQPQAFAEQPPQVAEVSPAPAPQFAEVSPAAAQFAEVEPTAPAPAPVVEAPAPEPKSVAEVVAAAAAAAPDAPSAFAAMTALAHKAQVKKPAKARNLVRKASLPRATGKSTAVVQIGAYGSPERVAAAWNVASRRYASLRAYSPMSARFNSSKGLVYRLSVRGFSNAEQAKDLCLALRRAGGNCFVRTVAGDTPVRIASR
jgi:D-alanyl-D-alanine carboxypeptidase